MASFITLVKHTLVYGSGVWAGKLIGFIMIPVYTRALAPQDYGVLELVTRTTDIVGMLFGLGMASALFRFHAEGKTDKERDLIINTSVVFAAAIALVAAAVLSAIARPISVLILGSERYTLYMLLALVSIGLELSTAVPMALLRIHERSALFTTINLGRLILALGLNIYLVVIRRMGVGGVLISNVIGIALVVLALFIMTKRYWKPRLDTRILKGMLAYSLPMVPSSLAMFVLNFGDRYFLRACCSFAVLGVYSLGYKLCMVMPELIMHPLGLAWSAVMFEVADRKDATRVYVRYFNIYMFCVVFSSLGIAALAHDLINLVAAPSYSQAANIVPVVLLGFVGWAATNVFEIGVLLEKKSYYRTFGNITAAVVAFVMYATLIPRFRAMGAAWATACSFIAMAVVVYILSQRIHPIPYDLRRAVQLVVLGGALYACTLLLPGNTTALTILLRVLIVSLYPLILLATGYFHPEEVQTAKRAVRQLLSRVGVGQT